MRLVQLAAIFVTALVLGAILATILAARTTPHFSALVGNDGVTLWRIDDRTGEVSVCGVALRGSSLARAEIDFSSRIRAAGAVAPVALGPNLDPSEIDQIDSLSRPRCSSWSTP